MEGLGVDEQGAQCAEVVEGRGDGDVDGVRQVVRIGQRIVAGKPATGLWPAVLAALQRPTVDDVAQPS